MLVTSFSPRTENFRRVSPEDEIELYHEDFDGFDTPNNNDNLPLEIKGDRIIPIYVLRDNFTGEEFTFIGYCPDIYNREQDCMLPAQITIHQYDFIPKGYKGGFDPIESISNKPREELVDWLKIIWLKNLDLDRENLDICSNKILFSQKAEVSPLRKKIAEFERFYTSKDIVADFTYNYARILSEGGDGTSLEIFSDVYSCLSKLDLDTYDFSDGFSEMVYRDASYEELEIYSEAALKLLFIGESLVDENDRFGGLNNACAAYVTRDERKKSLEALKSICDDVIKMTDKRYELLEMERERIERENLLRELVVVEEKNPFAYEGN